MTDWDDLRKKAEAATPGPWWVSDLDTQGMRTICAHLPDSNVEEDWIASVNELGPDIGPTAEFIAAANPAVVLELIREVETLRLMNATLTERKKRNRG